MPTDPTTRASLSGNQLGLVGATPTVCHRFVARPVGLDLLEASGCVRPERLLTYESEEELRAQFALLVEEGWRVAVNHALPVDVLSQPGLWIDRDLLCRLNDKAALPELVADEFLPRRSVASNLDDVSVPAVVKVSGPESSGAGFGVRLCRSGDELSRARRDLASAERFVVEELLDIAGSWCVQFIVDPAGAVHDLGSAEQVIGDDGSWQGNWVERDPPAALLDACREAVRRAASLGYRGVAGLDGVTTRDGLVRILDGNFRFNGSTIALLFRASIHAPVIRSRGFWFDGNAAALERAAHNAIERELLVVRGVCIPDEGLSIISGLVPGASRDEVGERIREVASLGFR